jgi:ribosome-binding protein aMBF1 (putative translation factor)
MNESRAKRVFRELTPSEKERLTKYREQIAQELPDLQARDQMRKDAREECTLSGELRRAIHASGLSLAELAAGTGITPILLDDFLTGERTLRSDVIDRLATLLGCELNRAR